MKFARLIISFALACSIPPAHAGATPLPASAVAKKPFVWENATIYFILTDRFYNANPANYLPYGRGADGAPRRGYAAGALAGVTAKIKEGYLCAVGVNSDWLTPRVEQI